MGAELARVCLDQRIIDAFGESFDLPGHVVCAATMGSTSHNTYVPPDNPDSIDDVDIMGIVVPPPAATFGLRTWEHWTHQQDELDVVLYSMRKLVGLLLKANPNVVGLLWLRPEHYLGVRPEFAPFIEHRDAFSSLAAYGSFVGYAHAQVQKMRSLAFEGYMGAKRKELVARHGYDTKMAAHAVRLLRTGIEFLLTGAMRVYRDDDAELIRSIKRGEWTLEQVQSETERLFREAEAARDNSWLPSQPDRRLAERLLLDATFAVWHENGEI